MKKIMIVDDQFTVRELVASTLEDEFEVIKAESGKQALELIEKNQPDLILLDIMMPDMDGYKVLEILKNNENTKNIPVVMLTAKHEMEDVKKAINLDVDEYITKPFEPSALKERIKCYFEVCKPTPDLLQFGKQLHYKKKE